MIARLIRLYGGLAVYGAGIGFQVESGLGNDPWNAFHQGLSLHTGLSIGTIIIAVGAVVMLLWIPLRQRPGIGTLSNVILLGLFADAAIWLLPSPGHVAVQAVYLALGVISIGLATVLYVGAGFGPGPRDGIMTGLVRLGLSVRMANWVIQLTVLAIGWLLGGTVGVGTLVFAFAIGPVTQLFTKWFPLDPHPARTRVPSDACGSRTTH